MLFCAKRDVHEGSLRAVMLSCRRRCDGRVRDLQGKPMKVGLVRRDIIKCEVLELHRK